jgi:hypothetical protein
MIHYGHNTPNITTYEDYTNFTGSAEATKIFQISAWSIGLAGIAPINVNADTEKHIYIGKTVTKKILGYPVAFKDSTDKMI